MFRTCGGRMRSAPTDRMQPVGEDRIFPLRCCGGRMISAPTNRTTRRGRSHLPVALLRRGVEDDVPYGFVGKKRALSCLLPGEKVAPQASDEGESIRDSPSENLPERARRAHVTSRRDISHAEGVYHPRSGYHCAGAGAARKRYIPCARLTRCGRNFIMEAASECREFQEAFL